MPIFIPNQVWAIDITYIKTGRSHLYLTAIIDWYSRFIVGWTPSDTLDTAPVLEAVGNKAAGLQATNIRAFSANKKYDRARTAKPLGRQRDN